MTNAHGRDSYSRSGRRVEQAQQRLAVGPELGFGAFVAALIDGEYTPEQLRLAQQIARRIE